MGNLIPWTATTAAVLGVPALIAAFAPRWRIVALIAWLLAPPAVLLIVMLGEPTAPDSRTSPFEALLFIGSLFAVPWLAASLVGYAIGVVLRPPRRRPAEAPSEPPAPPPPAPSSTAELAPAIALPYSWQPVHVGVDHDGLIIDGLPIWSLPWREEGSPSVTLPHPAHPTQRHDYTIYNIDDGKTATRFAAAELSSGVWGFYRWLVPNDAAHGLSLDGSLRYAHRVDEPDERYGGAVNAEISDAATGAPILAGGRLWAQSRVLPQADGALVLMLELSPPILFRIDPPARTFAPLTPPGAARALGELQAAAEALVAARRGAAPAAPPPPRVTRRGLIAAMLILVAALAVIAVLTVVTESMAPEPSAALDRVPPMPRSPAR